MPNNPEQSRSNQENSIPDEWKSLIQDGIYDLDRKRTTEYEQSAHGQKELAEEKAFEESPNAKLIQKRLEQLDEQVKEGVMSEEQAAAYRELYQQKYEKMLDKAVDRINDYRQQYKDGQVVSSPEDLETYERWHQKTDAENKANLEARGKTLDDLNGYEDFIGNQNTATAEDSTETISETITESPKEVKKIEVVEQSDEEIEPEPEAEKADAEDEEFKIEMTGFSPEQVKYLNWINEGLQSFQEQHPDDMSDDLRTLIMNHMMSTFDQERAIQKDADTTAGVSEAAKAETDIAAANEADVEAANEANIAAANEADIAAANEADIAAAEKARERLEKVKEKDGAKKWCRARLGKFAKAAAALLATGALIASMAAAFIHPETPNLNDIPNPPAIEQQYEAAPNVGELSNGVHYDYTEYADFDNKTSDYAYGYDKSDVYGNRDATADAWMEMANDGPEYLGSYAYYMLTDDEKAEIGIDGMTSAELDDYMSNAEHIDGGAKQRMILEKLDQIAHDQENTRYDFYHENDSEYSYYIVFDDTNSNGEYTPDELTLGYSLVARDNAPQVDVYRLIDGEWVKMIDLNMACGFQPNLETAPQGLPEIATTSTSTTPSETPGETPGGNPDTPETPPDEGLQPKNTEAEIANAGPRVDQQELNQEVTPPTTIEQDQANIPAVQEQQQSPGGMAGTQEEIAQQQAVDNSAETAQNDAEATANADTSAAERAQMFEEGNY